MVIRANRRPSDPGAKRTSRRHRPALIPDGTYPAHVDKVIDASHISATMQGTIKVDLTGSFGDKLKANDDIEVTLSKGKVTAFSKK